MRRPSGQFPRPPAEVPRTLGISRIAGELTMSGLPLRVVSRHSALVAGDEGARIGTPTYVYDLEGIAETARAVIMAFDGRPHLVAYAVKANSAGPIIRTLVAEGCGADVVSGAELLLAMRCGVSPERLIFSGVAKTDDELDLAIGVGDNGIRSINVESVEEIPRIAARASAQGRSARIALRINPGVSKEAIGTHSYITTGHAAAKFGVPLGRLSDATTAVEASNGAVKLVGIAAHAGSQLTAVDGYAATARMVCETAKALRPRFPLDFIDTGGGFGIDYGKGCAVKPADFIAVARQLQKENGLDDLPLFCEPGRALVGAHGVLITRVIQKKTAPGDLRWLMIDAGMNDLLRPALYQARHRIVPLTLDEAQPVMSFRVVGPVCESSDDFGDHDFPDSDLNEVAILDAGAYGYTLANRYNGRALPAEVFVRGGAIATVFPRKSVTDWVDDRK